MSQYQRVLLIADPAMRHSPALQRAAALAEATGASLHLSAFVEPLATLPLLDKGIQEETRERCLQERREWLADEAALMASKGVHVTREVVWTQQVREEILSHVREMQPDLLVKDLQHEPLLKRAFITPLDWHLLRDCPVPVHLVSQAANPLPKRVLAAVDPSQPQTQISGLNQRILAAANGLALQCNAELHLVHTYDLMPAYLGSVGAGAAGWSGDLVEELRQSQHWAFTALADDFGVPAERRHFIPGSPIGAIADFAAQQQMDVIVMGRVHRQGLSKLIGSTTEHILNHGPSSILAIS
ncbi:universal stress protein [Pseudomonas zhanjiangensis]|uniref:Universal stress protein n=1 Tax=Pseudomonas zhanjiangensis TaxID=3239015 RepID=A0ABV3Z0G5_9PSED